MVFKEEDGEKTSIGQMLVEKLPVFVQSADLEVQERVSGSYHVFYANELSKIIICIFTPAFSVMCISNIFQPSFSMLSLNMLCKRLKDQL